MLKLIQLPDIIKLAYHKREVHHLCMLAYEMAQAFNVFYTECHVGKQTDEQIKQGWLGLYALTLKELTLILDILSIEIPEKM